MCGRYTLSDPRRCLAEFSILEKSPAVGPRYNIAPSQEVWVLRVPGRGEGPRLDLLRWGLQRGGRPKGAAPSPGPRGPTRMAGALAMVRIESLATRASFADAFRARRCLFPADGFYEWRRSGGRSFPYYLRRPAGAPFVIAGIWYPGGISDEREEGAIPVDSCAVITRSARPPVDSVHDRMPTLLAPEHYDAWLDPAFDDTRALTRMLEQDPGFVLEARPVGPRVNTPAHDDPSCVADATRAERRGEQFDLWPSGKAFRTS